MEWHSRFSRYSRSFYAAQNFLYWMRDKHPKYSVWMYEWGNGFVVEWAVMR